VIKPTRLLTIRSIKGAENFEEQLLEEPS